MFPWLSPTAPRPDAVDRRAQVAAAELASRAGLLYRLGFSAQDATARLIARTRWEYDQPCHGAFQRPAALSDEAIARIVADTYARKPA